MAVAEIVNSVSPEQITMVSEILADGNWIYPCIILLGFIGGVLSGFIGSGGAFLITPGLMSLGIPGIMAVGSNLAHKFGKAIMGAKKHNEMGNVDKKLGIYLFLTAFFGIKLAVWINNLIFKRIGEAGSNLYVSLFFIGTLSVIGAFMLKESLNKSQKKRRPLLSNYLRISPMVKFPKSGAEVSLWVILIIGTAVGFMAGTIGVGGFLGVPAMIYIFGVPTAIAAGTELFLAIFLGLWGALNYAAFGFVDLRLTLLLYAGSLIGVYVGVLGSKTVDGRHVRMVAAMLILLCCISRLFAIPKYLGDLKLINITENLVNYLGTTSSIFLFGSGILATSIILYWIFRWQYKNQEITTEIPA